MRSRVVNAGLVVLSVFVSLFLIIFFKAYIDPLRTSVNLHSYQTDNYLFQPDDILGFRPRSQISVISFAGPTKFRVYTDRRGGRVSREYVDERKHSDIIGIGGSQTWGQGVPNEETFLALLGQKLGYSVSNLAVSGFGGVGALLRLRDNLDLAPKLVVYGLWEDHLNRNVRGCLEDVSPVCVERPYVRRNQQGNFVLVFPSHSEENLNRIRRFYLETATVTNTYRSLWTDMYWVSSEMGKRISTLWLKNEGIGVEYHDKWEAMEFVLKEMNGLTTSIGAQFVVVWIPLYFSSDIADPPQELLILSQELGFILVNLRERFLSMMQTGITIALPDDGHMNKIAHGMIASEIVTNLTVGRDGS